MNGKALNSNENKNLDSFIQSFENSAKHTDELLTQLETLGSNLNKLVNLLSPVSKLNDTLTKNSDFFENNQKLIPELERWQLEVLTYQENFESWQKQYNKIGSDIHDQIKQLKNTFDQNSHNIIQSHQSISKSIGLVNTTVNQSSSMEVKERLISLTELLNQMNRYNHQLATEFSLHQESIVSLSNISRDLRESLRENSNVLKQTSQYIDIFSDKYHELLTENSTKISLVIDKNLTETSDMINTIYNELKQNTNMFEGIRNKLFGELAEHNRKFLKGEDELKNELKANLEIFNRFEASLATIKKQNLENHNAFDHLISQWVEKNWNNLPQNKKLMQRQLLRDSIMIVAFLLLLPGIYLGYKIPVADLSEAGVNESMSKVVSEFKQDIIKIRIYNGCGVEGISAKTANFLEVKNIEVIEITNWKDYNQKNTRIMTGKSSLVSAFQIAETLELPKDRIEIQEGLLDEVWLILGGDYNNLKFN